MIRKALITTAAVVTVLGGTATALAVTGSSSGGTVYHGCEGGKLGRTIYDVYSNGTVPKCPARWPFSWNSTGPAGPQGPAGPAGKDAAVLGPVFSDTTSQSISTGGAGYENATKLGTLTLDPGTYLLEANFVATPNEVNSAQIFPQLLVTAVRPDRVGLRNVHLERRQPGAGAGWVEPAAERRDQLELQRLVRHQRALGLS